MLKRSFCVCWQAMRSASRANTHVGGWFARLAERIARANQAKALLQHS